MNTSVAGAVGRISCLRVGNFGSWGSGSVVLPEILGSGVLPEGHQPGVLPEFGFLFFRYANEKGVKQKLRLTNF